MNWHLWSTHLLKRMKISNSKDKIAACVVHCCFAFGRISRHYWGNLCIFSIAAHTWRRSSLIKETEVLFLCSRGVTITQKMRGRGDVYSWKLISLWYDHIVRLNVLWCVRHLNLADKSRLEKTTLLLLKQRNFLLSCLVLLTCLKLITCFFLSPLNLII